MLKLSFALLSLLLSHLCFAQPAPTREPSTPELVVGFYEFPPWIYTDHNGQVRGTLYDTQRKLILRSGYQPRFRSLPSARLYNGLRDGSVHLWTGAAGKAGMADFTLESDSLLGYTYLNLYYPASRPEPKIPEDLRNKNIILISGYTYWPSVNRLLQDPDLGIQTHRTSNHASALQMLERNRGDYLINYAAPVRAAFQDLDHQPLKHIILDRLAIRFILSKETPEAEKVLQTLDANYQQMVRDGELPPPQQFD